MGIKVPAQINCDRCGLPEHAHVVIDKVVPSVHAHLQLPSGWGVSSKADSQEVYVLCPQCIAGAVSLMPHVEFPPDPTTDPTIPPPPKVPSK